MKEKKLNNKIKNLLIDLIRGEDDIDNIQTSFEDLFREEIKEAYSKGLELGEICVIKIADKTILHPWNYFMGDKELGDYLKTKGL